VLILGAASGVSTFAVQLAAQAGARVLVTSSADEKIRRARDLGASAGVNYVETEDWPAAARDLGPIDLVIDSVGSTWQQALYGTQLGSPRDFEALLRMLAAADWRPVIDSVRPLVEAASALARMQAGEHFGKLVLSID